MKFLLQYLKSHGRVCLGFLICAGLYGLIAWAYGIPMEAVGYTAFLCLGVLVILGSVDLLRSWNRYKILEQLKEREILTADMLPDPRSDLEESYQELLTEILHRKMKGEARRDQKLSELIEYYTLWVHQIKTPIAAMHLLLQTEEHRQELDEELFQIERYVEMVLGYARVETMEHDLSLGQVSLDDLIRQAVKKYARLFIQKKVTLDFQPTGKRVLTDEKWLVFVLEQLLSNAVKYTPSGGRVTVRLLDPGSEVLLIEDTGIGIAPEDLPRIFEQGYTGYNGRQDKKSTGIGLYLCQKIAGQLSHRLSVSSVPGEGTRVSLDFSLYSSSNLTEM